MVQATIDGKPAALAAAVEAAAGLFGRSRSPLIAGLGTDIAGARAAVALAERVGATVDHMHAGALLRDLDVMREAGMMIVTPNEARLRADLLLLVGPGLVDAWPELPERLLGGSPDGRRVVWLCPGGAKLPIAAVTRIGRDATELPALLAALRARIAGRPVGPASLPAKQLDRLAADLKGARFGVAVWSAAALDALAIEMLCGIVKDLNAATRFSGLPLAAGDNAVGVMQACGWLSGFPMRTGFGRGIAEHDPWRFDAARLVAAGETDCVLWISAYRAAAPAWDRHVPLIALTGEAAFRHRPRVHIAVGRPGQDHDSVEHSRLTGTLAAVGAPGGRQAVSVAGVLSDILNALPGPAPC
jgi:formylmethanofuran dehydrogenase subunit B